MKLVMGVAGVALTLVMGVTFYERHQHAVEAKTKAQAADCADVRMVAERERLPDGTLPSDARTLNIRLGICEEIGL